jgi:hypothetical protein
MGNAVKFTTLGGDIQLSVSTRRRTAVDAELEISVQDSGHLADGFAASDHPTKNWLTFCLIARSTVP